MTVRGKKIAAVAGGAFGLAVLVCGWLVFSTGSKASKAARQLKRAAAEFGSEQAKTPVPEKTAAARSDAEACGKRAAARFEKIREMSFKREDMTIGAFQSTLQAKFAELSALEHGSQVPLVKNEPGKEFDFGFKTRSFGDADTVRLPALQRQLADTEALVNMLARSHIVQIEEIAVPKEDSAGKASETEAGGKPGIRDFMDVIVILIVNAMKKNKDTGSRGKSSSKNSSILCFFPCSIWMVMVAVFSSLMKVTSGSLPLSY